MLMALKVSDFAIIESIHMTFRPGLNVLSGETGAGKSILIKSLALLMGEKADTDAVRTGCDQAVIEGAFDISRRPDIQRRLTEMGIDSDDDLIVRRLISRQGKGRVYLNGALTPLHLLREVVSPLVEITGQSAPLIEMTGQHDNRHLLARNYQLDLLDQFGKCASLRQEFLSVYTTLKQVEAEIERLTSESRDRLQRLDYLCFQRDEIQALNLDADKDLEFEAEVKRVKNAARLSEFTTWAEELLDHPDESIIAKMGSVLGRAQDLAKYDPILVKMCEPLSSAQSLLQDVVFELQAYREKLQADPERLEALEQRLSDLRRVQKKYGSSVSDILEAFSQLESEIDKLENFDAHLQEQEKLRDEAAVELKKIGEALHRQRKKSSNLLSEKVNQELKDLNMQGVLFQLEMRQLSTPAPDGFDEVEFMIQNGSADVPRPLAKFASGGELSRILLAIKKVIGTTPLPRTYLFDEVDAGISGPTAEMVGRKLKTIARDQQVVCVTHLPQVASFGDVHFHISKSMRGDHIEMKVMELKKSQRIDEIARLISGEKISKTSLAHAEQLLNSARV